MSRVRAFVPAAVVTAVAAPSPARADPPPSPPPVPLEQIVAAPAFAPRATVEEIGSSPDHYGAPPPSGRLGLRVAAGVDVRLAGAPGNRAAFALDTYLTGRLGVDRGYYYAGLFPELGYSLTTSRGSLGLAGLGAGILERHISLALVPRFAAGVQNGSLALGMRTSLLAELDWSRYGADVAYQWLVVDGQIAHEIRITLSLDPLAVLLGKLDTFMRIYGPELDL